MEEETKAWKVKVFVIQINRKSRLCSSLPDSEVDISTPKLYSLMDLIINVTRKLKY